MHPNPQTWPFWVIEPNHPLEDIKRKDFVASVAFTEVQMCRPKFIRGIAVPCKTMALAGQVYDGGGEVEILKTVLHHAACLTVATTSR